MKKIFSTILSMAAFSLAANIQVLAPTGAEFSPDAPNMVQSLVRASVSETGNTPVENDANIQLRTNVMAMGSSFVVVCEQVKDGAVVGSGKQKAGSIDDLDVAIEGAVKSALSNVEGDYGNYGPYASSASSSSDADVVMVVSTEKNEGDPNDNFAHKRPTRKYRSLGLGAALWHNYEFKDKSCKNSDDPKACHKENDTDKEWDEAFVLHYARIYEVTPQAAITIVNNTNMSFSEDWQWHEVLLLGGRFFPSTGVVTPFLGLGAGLGMQLDCHYETGAEAFAFGLAAGAEIGAIFFRNSSAQLEVGFAWDALWDGFDSFDRRFGAASFYIAINY